MYVDFFFPFSSLRFETESGTCASHLQFTHTADPIQFWQCLTVGLSPVPGHNMSVSVNSISDECSLIIYKYVLTKWNICQETHMNININRVNWTTALTERNFYVSGFDILKFWDTKLARTGKFWHFWLKKLNKQCHFIYNVEHWRLYAIFIISL